MPKVTYIHSNGTVCEINVSVGNSVMEGAVKNDIAGIVGQCGGCRSCGTCHVYVQEAWLPRVGPASSPEQELIDFSGQAQPNSRLACQIKMSEALDGLIVVMADNGD
jgi:2Fe-2S ferredoxin